MSVRENSSTIFWHEELHKVLNFDRLFFIPTLIYPLFLLFKRTQQILVMDILGKKHDIWKMS